MILYFMLRALKRIEKFVLFSSKDNQEEWMESDAHLEPRRRTTMELFVLKRKKAVDYFRKKNSIINVWQGSKYASGNNRRYQCSNFPSFAQMYLLLDGWKDMFSEAAFKRSSTKFLFLKIIEQSKHIVFIVSNPQ